MTTYNRLFQESIEQGSGFRVNRGSLDIITGCLQMFINVTQPNYIRLDFVTNYNFDGSNDGTVLKTHIQIINM